MAGRPTKAAAAAAAAEARTEAITAFAVSKVERLHPPDRGWTVTIPDTIDLQGRTYLEIKSQLLGEGGRVVPRTPRVFAFSTDPYFTIVKLAGTAPHPPATEPIAAPADGNATQPQEAGKGIQIDLAGAVKDTSLPAHRVQTKWVKVGDIIPDPTQPRKHFSDARLAELTESVRKHGILQNISVRHQTGAAGDDSFYMIIAGERRWRAADTAGLELVRVDIYDVTDLEVADMQMTENLHRADIHPMEEGLYFQHWMAQQEGRTYHELATRIDKSESYVRNRLKLVNLTTRWQELFLDSGISLTDATTLAGASAETQDEYYDSLKLETREPGTTVKLQTMPFFLGNRSHLLATAPFATEDPSLNPERGACSGCGFNTAVKELFSDTPPTCTLPSCFRTKTINDFLRRAKAHQAAGGLFIQPSWVSKDDEFWIELCHQHGIQTLNAATFSQMWDAPDQPGIWEDYAERERQWPASMEEITDEDDMDEDGEGNPVPWTAARIAELEAGLRADHEKELAEYDEKMAEWQKKNKGATMAFLVDGDTRAALLPIRLKEAAATAAQQSSKGNGAPAASPAKVEIINMKTRAARADQLADEKLWEEIRGLAQGSWEQGGMGKQSTKRKGIEIDLQERDMTTTEAGALCVVLWNDNHLTHHSSPGKDIVAHLGIAKGGSTNEIDKRIAAELLKRGDQVVLRFLLRLFLIKEGFPQGRSHKEDGLRASTYEFVRQRRPQEVTELELEHEQAAIKRKASLESRIKGVERKYADAQPKAAETKG